MRTFWVCSFIFCSLLLSLACNRQQPPKSGNTTLPGYSIYQKYCTVCHGTDGKYGFGGAKDLSASALDKAVVQQIVAKGKGAMTPYESVLSADQIAEVSDYVLTLRLTKP